MHDATPRPTPDARPCSNWLDAFFASYYRHRPVSATFIGVHEYDDRLPDYSPAGVAAVRAEMADLLRQLDDGSVAPPVTPAEVIDATLARGFLTLQLWEYGSGHFVTANPTVYTGEAIFGVIALFLRPFAPLPMRVESAIARLHAIPALLAQGRANVRAAPLAWTERAIRECGGALAFLTEGVDILIADEGITDPRFRRAADTAREAFAAHEQALRGLQAHDTGAYACGAEAFDRYLQFGHQLTITGADIDAYTRAQFTASRATLEGGAAAFGMTGWRDALATLADHHPTAAEYYARFRHVWDACHDTATAHDLVTWPNYPLRYVPQPRWARGCASALYFLPYRAPAPNDHAPVVDYLVPPLEPEMPREEQERRLRAVNNSVIKLNHVVHHGAIGHQVQNWYATRAASRIGQVAAVDCASRIALFCGGTMAEGWSSYAVDLMDETGFLTPLESYSQQYARLRASARAIVDVNLHHGTFSLADATAFYRDDAGFTPEAAYAEAVKNSLYPGAAVMYLIGQDAIRDLRTELAESVGSAGEAFSLRRFHDRLLSFGSVPVTMIAAAMRAEANGASHPPHPQPVP